MPEVEWTEAALEDLGKLDRQIARRILKKITWLSRHFESTVPEQLSGDLGGVYKLRVGDWRVLYVLETGVIVIQAVGHRREIYE